MIRCLFNATRLRGSSVHAVSSFAPLLAGVILLALGASFMAWPGQVPSPAAWQSFLDDEVILRAQAVVESFDQEWMSCENSPWVILHRAYASAGDFDLVDGDVNVPFTSWLEDHMAPDAEPIYHGLPLVSDGINGPEMTPALGRLAHRGFESHLGQFTFLVAYSSFDWRADEPPLGEAARRRLAACAMSAKKKCLDYVDPTFILLVDLKNDDPHSDWIDQCDRLWTTNSLAQAIVQEYDRPYPCLGAHRLLAISALIDGTNRGVDEGTLRQAQMIRSSAVRAALEGDLFDHGESVGGATSPMFDRARWAEDLHRLGHTLEWILSFDQRWSVDERATLSIGIRHLIELILQRPSDLTDIEYGSLCHGIRALRGVLSIDHETVR